MKRLMGVLAVAAALVWAAPVWAACCMHGQQCPIMKQHAGESEATCPVTSKVIEKAKFLLEHADAIGLSDEQVQAIKAIKLDAKKAALRQEADMKIFELDVKAKMSEPKLDAEGLNTMLDGAGAGMSAEAKRLVAQYATLKAVLSEDQMSKAKKVWKTKQ